MFALLASGWAWSGSVHYEYGKVYGVAEGMSRNTVSYQKKGSLSVSLEEPNEDFWPERDLHLMLMLP